ncbi:M20 family metallopeptidase [Hydrogenivirga sp.]
MELKERVVTLLKELIGIPSVSGKEKEVQESIEGRLRGLGLNPLRQYVGEERFNLILPSETPYVISCHVDTVPPMGMRDAFNALEIDGRVYGRGASDVKGALASLLTAVEVFRREHPTEGLPVSIALVVDEENNSALGSERVVEFLGKDRLCLVLEPTYGVLCTAQNGALEFTLRVEGESAHGAEFEKVENPIRVCMKLVERIEGSLSRPVNVLMLRGGARHYAVPKRCEALLEVKLHEGDDWREVEERIRETLKDMRTSCKVSYKREDAENFLRFRCDRLLDKLTLAYRNSLREEPRLGVMPSWTDAANFHRAGYECVVFGFGSLKDSHTDRESISTEELEKMVLFFKELFEVLR